MGGLICKDHTQKLIQDFLKIIIHRDIIESKLNELNLESNDELQKIYIQEDLRNIILLRNKRAKESFKNTTIFVKKHRIISPSPVRLKNGRIITSRVRSRIYKSSIQTTFDSLLNVYKTDPWLIKSPHINRIKKNKKIKFRNIDIDLKKINEKIIEI
tara:strand:+ start:46 stop:516 length:471 start_codon:yes stop_codon:yes gene_type:complete